MILAHPVPTRYRLPLLGAPDPLLRRALLVSGALGLVWLVLVWIAPAPAEHETTVEDLPERFARLIVDEPKPPASAPSVPVPGAQVETQQTPEVATPEPEPKATPRITPRQTTRQPEPRVAVDRGQAGREQARTQVTRQLEQVSADVNQTLESLANVLPAATSSETASAAPPRRGGRAPRAGRSESSVGTSSTRGTTGAAELGSTGLAAGASDLGDLGAFDLASVEGQAGDAALAAGRGAAAGTGDRSASSLMAVVRRYAPGIRYCYDTALESDRSLRGKMVFRITVATDGRVAAVDVVEDTLNSADVRRCALAQIEAWRFGTATSASVFNAPFVFRPTE